MSVHRKPDGKWYSKWRDEHGRQHTKVFGPGEANRKLAKAHDYQIKSAKKLNHSTLPACRSAVYLDNLAQGYVNDCRTNGKGGRWLDDLVNLLNNHWLPRLTHKPVDELTYQDMLEFMEPYKEHSQTTRNRYFDYLKVIFNFGIRHGLTRVNPLSQWQKKKEPPRQTLLTMEDFMKIQDAAEPHLKWALEVVWYTGIRPGPKELLSLRWEHVDFDRGVIRVLGKRNLWREIPLSDTFRQRLLEQKDAAKTEYLVEYEGQPIKQVRRAFGTAVRRAGITYPCCFYDVRHLFATLLLNKGADLAAVSKILGHTSTRMTADQYYHLLYGEKLRAVTLVPEIPSSEHDGEKVVPIGKKVSRKVSK